MSTEKAISAKTNDISLGFVDKEMTRRQFMKISGKALAGVTLSVSMLNLLGCTQSQVDRGFVTVIAHPEGLLVVNADLCIGCVRCEVICSLMNDGAVSTHNARLNVTRNLFSNRNGVGMYADLRKGWVYYPDTCRQCRPAPCQTACPFNAISESGGVKVINPNACNSCGLCRAACPWDMININSITGKATKCTNCGECEKRCPTGALNFITWNAVQAAAQSHWRS